MRNQTERAFLALTVLVCSAASLTALPAAAQQNCSWSNVSDPTRQLITCNDTLKLERTPGSEITIIKGQKNAAPRAIELNNGAIFIDVVPGSTPTQIRTPHAIAAVRGTTYVVDAGQNSTSVFVIKGSVNVSKQGSATSVDLGPGEGVDVENDAPLTVKTWPENRVSELLSRFGR